jgi:hypothetical protein
MPVLLGQVQMNDLAQKLAKMRFNKAKAHIRHIDKKNRLHTFRVAVGDNEWHTRYTLPSLNLMITLLEHREETGSPNHLGLRRTRFRYVRALVEPLPESMRNREERFRELVEEVEYA